MVNYISFLGKIKTGIITMVTLCMYDGSFLNLLKELENDKTLNK